MKNQHITLLLIILTLGCYSDKAIKFKEYDFKFEGMTFNGNPYKFSTEIEEVLKDKGNHFAAFEYSYIGDIEQVLKIWNRNKPLPEELIKEDIKNFEKFIPKKATNYIVKEAKKHKITIINEAHHMPQHRVFTTKILQQLYDIGYRHIGLEALMNISKTNSLLTSNKYPVMENGYYIKEPQLGNLVRQALKIGYKVFSYESLQHKDFKEREINQAKNIETYIAANSKGKVLIHCGFAHGTEGIIGGKWEKAMAQRLSELTGINPLSINQTTYSEKGVKEVENLFYRLTEVNEPTIFLKDKEDVFGKYKEGSWFDISVFHPRTKNYNRPEWLLFGERKEEVISLKDAPIDFPCIVIAYLEGEKIGYAVPYDVKEAKDREVTLVLKPGNYRIILRNEKNNSLLFDYHVKR